jgi:sodium/potassium-transporting ATPase subunit alpha
MTPPKEIPLVIKYLICLSNLFNVLLVISGILCYIVYPLDPVGNAPNLYIGAILIGVAMMNALIDFVQEIKSAAMLKSFLDLVPRKTMVIRDKQLISVQASELVPGDVVFVRMGDKNPADILVFWSVDFKVQPAIFSLIFIRYATL